jgi:hypothetical protein
LLIPTDLKIETTKDTKEHKGKRKSKIKSGNTEAKKLAAEKFVTGPGAIAFCILF